MYQHLQLFLSFRVMQPRRRGWGAQAALLTRTILCILTLQCFLIASVRAQQPSRPLIFIPGILGSKLVNENGKLIWGGRDSYVNFHKLGLPRDDAHIKLQPDGVIDTIPIVWPLKVKRYNSLLKTLQAIGYKEGKNFFVFAYDWRRSNFKTAEILDNFIDETTALRGREFDIVAHSMGGIVSLILIHEHNSGNKVKNLVTLGTPFFGSLNAFDAFLNGFDGVCKFMTEIGSSADKVRAVMFSFESGYELLPTYANCCILGKQRDTDRTPVDIFGLDFWQNEWLPSLFSNDEAKQFVADSLQRGKRLSQLVRKDLPDSLNLYMYAGDKYETKTQIYLERTGDIETYSTRGGDGIVWLISAARNRVQDSRVSFKKHARIFDDNHLKKEIQRILAPSGPIENFAASAHDVEVISVTGKRVPVELVSFEVKPPIVKLGKAIKVVLNLNGTTIVKSDEKFNFSVCVSATSLGDQKSCFNLSEVEIEKNTRRFQADYLPTLSGDYTIRVTQSDELEDYFAVVGGS